MKTTLFINVIILSCVFVGGLIAAAGLSVASPGERRPPAAVADEIILPEYAEPAKLEAILLKLGDPDPFVRVEAVQALGEMQKKKSLVAVCNSLHDENIYVRAYAAEALGKIGRVDISYTFAKLLPVVNDPSPYVRAMMVAALGELRDARALDSIGRFLDDEDKTVRGMAKWALKQIEGAQ